jgi:hypothetical protein
MTKDQKIIRAKVGLLELAKQLGNVNQACKMMGYSRDSFYRFKGASKNPKMRTLLYGIECDSEKPRDFIGTRHEAARFFRFFRAADEAAEDAGFS